MEIARNFDELKEYVSVWGLRENRREHPRYQVDIQGHYYIKKMGSIVARDRCNLVDVNRDGVAIKVQNLHFAKGAKLHLQFFAGHNRVDVVGKAVHIKSEDDYYLVGVQSISTKVDYCTTTLRLKSGEKFLQVAFNILSLNVQTPQ